MIEFGRIVPVVNEHCTNVQRAVSYLEDLYDSYPNFYDPSAIILTSRDSAQTVRDVRGGTRDGDLVVVVGGDGTIGATAEAIGGRDITMLTTWAGNGNDSSRDLNGEADARPIHELLRDGKSVAVHPLAVTVDSMKTFKAVNYFEIGSNPKGAKMLNSDWWRNLPGYDNDRLRLWYEKAMLPPTAFFSLRFPVTEHGVTRKLVNFTAANSHYMAKLAELPVHLDEPRAFLTEAATQPGLLPWAIQAVRGTLRGEYLEKGGTRELTIGRTVLYHADAEPDVIEKGSRVRLAISEIPFYAVSSRQH